MNSSAVDEEHSDTELVRRFRGGEARAFATIVERYQDTVFSLCYRQLMDLGRAEEVAQAIFATAHQSMVGLRADDELRTWLLQLSIDQCLEAELPPKEPDLSTLEPRSRLVQEALAAIEPAFRATLILRDILGLPHDVVGEILGLPLGTVRSRVHHARILLARTFSQRIDAL